MPTASPDLPTLPHQPAHHTYPHRNGVYFIEQDFDNAPGWIEDAITLPTYFKQNGYRILRGGKIYHRTPEGDSDNWDESGERRGWNWMGKLVGPEGVSAPAGAEHFRLRSRPRRHRGHERCPRR